jgi:hypothetical protein
MSAYAELFFKRHFNLTTDHREEMAIFLSWNSSKLKENLRIIYYLQAFQ